MPFTQKSKYSAQEIVDKYNQYNEELSHRGLLPLLVQIFYGSVIYPTKEGKYLIKNNSDEAYCSDESAEGKRLLRMAKLQKINERTSCKI